MVFRAGTDPNRHMGGAKPDPTKAAKRAAEKSKLRKLRLLLNKHIDKAIDVAADLMQTASSDETKLRAAVFITQQFVKIHGDVIAEEMAKHGKEAGQGEDTSEDDSQDDSAAVFSLNLVEKK